MRWRHECFQISDLFENGTDGNFSNELLINTINVDLANDLGNTGHLLIV